MNDIPASTITPQRPLRIFLSHSSADKPAVRDLYQRLKADGFEPWLDEEDLLPGQDWQREIPRAVRESDVVIVCLSHGSVNRAGYIQKEIKFALDAADEKPEDAIFIIPLRLEECKVPDHLKRWQWVNLFDPNGYKRLLRTFATQFSANSLPPTIVAAQSEEIAVARPKNSETVQSSSMVSTQSGGIDLKANDVAIGQDAVGRDKVVSAGGHIIHAEFGSTVVVNDRPTDPVTEYPFSRNGQPESPLSDTVHSHKIIDIGRFTLRTMSPWAVVLGIVIVVIAFVIFVSIFNPNLNDVPTATSTALPTFTLVPTKPPTPTSAVTLTPITTPLPTSTFGIGSTRVATDGMTLHYVPAGEFLMGAANSDSRSKSNEYPQHAVYLDAFWIDQTEVTNAMYAKCVAANACQSPSSTKSYTRNSYYGNQQYDAYPVILVTWNDAMTYCQWVGGNLPTEAQWEKAARGVYDLIYPWGNHAPGKTTLNYNQEVGDTTRVGSYSFGASPYGALDMAGNVWEWVADWYVADYYSSSPSRNPTGPTSGEERVRRGGSWYYIASVVRASNRGGNTPSLRDVDLGFRCAR